MRNPSTLPMSFIHIGKRRRRELGDLGVYS
jgi:hypothetical protein